MNDHYKFENTPLPYAYDALEPYLDARTMELHHDKHLQAYTDHLNLTLSDQPRLQRLSLEQLIRIAPALPERPRIPIQRNAGGVYNHRFFFSGMQSPRPASPSGALLSALNKAYGSPEAFQAAFKAAALAVFGSGYAWLAADRCGRLKIVQTANQDTPLTAHLCPILNLDVWEHAYYLKYQNRRSDYIDAWFSLINWDRAEENFAYLPIFFR